MKVMEKGYIHETYKEKINKLQGIDELRYIQPAKFKATNI